MPRFTEDLEGMVSRAIGRIERTLRNMIEEVLRSTMPRRYRDSPASWNSDNWWQEYISGSMRSRWEQRRADDEQKFKEELSTEAPKHPWMYASLDDLTHIIDRNWNAFSRHSLFDKQSSKLHYLWTTLDQLVESRRPIAHQTIRPTFHHAKQSIRLAQELLNFIPPHCDESPDFRKTILAYWQDICQVEDTERYFNFPPQLKSFVGRTAELNKLQQSVLKHRLVTLHGIGGVGKTHLATHVTKSLAAEFPDGIAFVPLAGLSKDVDALWQAIARAFGETIKNINNEQALIHFLKSKSQRLLLLLDNWETVHTTQTETFLHRLLAQNDRLHLFVTSQVPINLEEIEQLESVEPLPTQGDLTNLDAYHLFLDRARLKLGPDWQPTDLSTVQEILRATDGLPLAIELVATHIHERTLADLAQGLKDSRLSVLRRRTGALVTTPERHESIEACFTWTYQLLPHEVQVFFPSLGVFVGGFTPEAAAFVGDIAYAQDLLDTLYNASLIQRDAQTGRYSLLRIVQEYTLERAGSSIEHYRLSHAQYFKDLAKRHGDYEDDDFHSQDLEQDFGILEADLDNLLAGMKFARALEDFHAVVTYVRGLRRFFWRRGYWPIARERLSWGIEAAQSIDDKASEARFTHRLAVILNMQNAVAEAELLHKRGLVIGQQLGDPDVQAIALYALAGFEIGRQQYKEAKELLWQSLALRGTSKSETRKKWGQALVFHQMGYVATKQYRFDDAERFYQRALKIQEEIYDREGITATLRNLGMVFTNKKQWPLAEDHYQRSLTLSEQLGDRQGKAATLHGLGRLAADQKQNDPARTYFEQSLEIKREIGNRQDEAHTLKELGRLEKEEGNLRATMKYWTNSLKIYEERGSPEAEKIRRWLQKLEREPEG